MIDIKDVAKAEYIKDSVAKVITISDVDSTDITKVNLITGNSPAYSVNINLTQTGRTTLQVTNDPSWSGDLTKYCKQYFPCEYTCFACSIGFYNIDSLPTYFNILFCYYDDSDNYFEFPVSYKSSDFDNKYKTININRQNVKKLVKIEIAPYEASDLIKCQMNINSQIVCVNDDPNQLPLDFIVTDWSKTKILKPFELSNNQLQFENFKLTESLCSQDNLKFGLCESAHCEFKFTDAEKLDLKDRRFKAQIKLRDFVDYYPDDDLEVINYYDGNSSPANAYTKTESGSSDTMYGIGVSVNVDLTSIEHKGNSRYACVSFKAKFSALTASITPYYITPYVHADNRYNIWDITENYRNVPISDLSDWTEIRIYFDYKTDNYSFIEDCYFRFKDQNKSIISGGTVSFTLLTKEWQVNLFDSLSDTPAPFDINKAYVFNGTLDDYLYSIAYTSKIPLGFFNVKEVKTQYIHNLCEKTITAYDDLLKLEANAMDWYTTYMFGVDTNSHTSNGFEFARQIFSSYFNFVIGVGLDSKDNYKETQIAYYDYWDDIKPSHLSDIYKSWDSSAPIKKIRYCEFSVNDPDPTKLYMVSFTNPNGDTDRATVNQLPEDYFTEVDPLGRGVATNGSILVKVYRNGSTEGYCVNKNDYFMIPSDCTSFDILTPAQTVYDDNTGFQRLLDNLTIYEVEKAPKLVNGHVRLVYYNYGTKELFEADSSITGRDVIHSLLEPCGCFFRLSRIKGIPEFIYPTKSGLYPSNTLYPADDLYPRAGTDGLFSLGRYISFICEDFEVKNYGRIQILKKASTNKAESICEWEYIGNPDEINTYIFDDNIFYCAEGMEYDYDAMPEVSEMLQNMFINIANLGYTPNDTNALGMPWLECGDRIGLLTFNGGVESFVFRRTLKGIQNLKDLYESRGDEYTEAINDYGYKIWEGSI